MQVEGSDGCGWSARADGGPVRLRRNGRRSIANGLYFSVKSGRHLPYESHLELHDLWRAEVDVGVVRSWPQPFTLTYADGDRLRRYTPDRKDERADGRVEIVEIKEDAADVTTARMQAVEAALSARGWSYRVVGRAEIEREPAFSAVRAVQRHRRTALDEADALQVRAMLASGPSPLSEVVAQLGSGPQPLAKACALMVRRVVAIDLAAGLAPHAQVRAL